MSSKLHIDNHLSGASSAADDKLMRRMYARGKYLRSHETHMGSFLTYGYFSAIIHTVQCTCESCAVDSSTNATWGAGACSSRTTSVPSG